MDKVKNALESWNTAPIAAKVLLATMLSGLLAAVAVVGWSAGQTPKVPLIAGQSLEEVSRVTAKLDELGAPYELAANGSTVLVDEGQRQQLRVELAGAGIMAKQAPGFELFENSQLQRSDFSERVTYLRALQGELAATISEIPEIKSARVHLNIPRETLFMDDATVPTASVLLELNPGMNLSKTQVAGILHLVAGSVDGMKPESVTLMDASGALHLSGESLEEMDQGKGADGQDTAGQLTNAGQTLVDRVLGPGRAVVRVQVQYAEEDSRTERETVEPVSGGRGLPISEEGTEESYLGTRRASAGEGGGVVSVAPSPAPRNADSGESKPSYSQKSNKVQYEVNRVKETVERKRGRIARVSASVVVDAGLKLSDKELASLAEGVKGAVGYSNARGDGFSLEAVAFRRDYLEDLSQPVAATAAVPTGSRLGLLAAVAVGCLALAGLLYALARRKKKKASAEAAQTVWVDVDQHPPLLEENITSESTLDLTLPEEIPYLEPLLDREALLREVGALAAEHPDLVARIIERWLTE